MARTPSPQQAAVYEWVRRGTGNALVVAVAGAGKTTTILNASSLMSGSVAIAAYNKKIADEITGKLRGANVSTKVQAGTFHSFGLRNWRKQAPKVRIEGDKVKRLIEAAKVPEQLEEFVGKLVSLAKQRALGVLEPIAEPQAWRYIVNHYDVDESLPEDKVGDFNMDEMVEDGIGFAQQVLRASLEMDEDVIDFDDMILAPLAHFCRVWRNDWLLVDEAQDTNPARRALAKKMLADGGRAIFVGDPAQAIYGFTGADNDSLEIIRREFACKELPLTVTYRCPQAVVALARQFVSHITAHESAPEGCVSTITDRQFGAQPESMFTKDAAMLCRTTAPLVAGAYALLRRGIPCHVEGKQIGAGLLNLARKWQVKTLDRLEVKLDEYLAKEAEKFLAKGQEQKAEVLADKVETIKVIIAALPGDATPADLHAQIKKLFGDTPEGQESDNFTFSTVHKSKGREWDTVYLLDRGKLMPSRYARQDWQLQQEYNLIYVAFTRAKANLIEVVTVK